MRPVNRLDEGFSLGGRYSLLERISSGGASEVWRAHDSTLSRTVAVKVLRPTSESGPVPGRLLRDEALCTAGLRHPNIAQIFDYDEDDTLAYLVMELVPGEPLTTLMQREGPLPTAVVRSIMSQTALALGAAHEAGVVHRDVRPSNILLTLDGVVKLTDFGAAQAFDGSGLPGEVLATSPYRSPEQALGGASSAASDLYALGVVAHELLMGRRCSEASTPSVTDVPPVWNPAPQLPSHVPPELRASVEQCLAQAAGARPTSARALGERLREAQDDVRASSVDDLAGEVVGLDAQAGIRDQHPRRAHAPSSGRRSPGAHRAPISTSFVRRVRGPRRASRALWAWIPATGAVALVGIGAALTGLH